VNTDPHYNTDSEHPQSKAEVEALSNTELDDFMGFCDAEPADFENCLACFAYLVSQYRDSPKDRELRKLMRANGGSLDSLVTETTAKDRLWFIFGQFNEDYEFFALDKDVIRGFNSKAEAEFRCAELNAERDRFDSEWVVIEVTGR